MTQKSQEVKETQRLFASLFETPCRQFVSPLAPSDRYSFVPVRDKWKV
jgi:hypothetical protein